MKGTKIGLGSQTPPAEGKPNNVVCHRVNAVEAETDFLANECHLVVVNGVLGHHVENPRVLFGG
jgi:hypothetical protein